MWEYDFFKNHIFNKNFYDIEVNFILYDNNTKINKKDGHNIIVTNSVIKLNILEDMIKILKPFAIFHLSDEYCRNIKYYDLYHKYNIKVLFHQYNSEKIDYKIKHFQIPLGYVSGFLLDNFDINQDIVNKYNFSKKYDFCFVGSLKNDRIEMLDKFKNSFKNNLIHTGLTNWTNPMNQNIKPNQLFNLYKESLFVPIGRGNISLDCFRLYEAIAARSIPVICGDIKEINVTFKFNNKIPNIIISETWDKAIILCNELYNDIDKLCNIINSNIIWLNNQIINISQEINNLL